MTTRQGTPNPHRKPALPVAGQRNVLITSALPYVNNVPHLGNIVGSLLSADVYARYCRQRGYNTLYICGTDEYGTATETKALEEKMTPQEICSKYYEIHRQVYDWFDISFDYFGRTSTDAQTTIAQDIFTKLNNNGLLLEETIQQLYDPEIKRFLADRFVKGTCPHCAYEDARGDQCDQCGKLLNPTELINFKSTLSKAVPVLKDTTHLFLDLPNLQDKVAEWFTESSKSNWTEVAKTITSGWLKDGLKPRCITRDLSWGTPVPIPKFADKVFYVWFDAPIGYPSITANALPNDWERWWKDPDNVEYVQFMGKDNVPFHSIIFPASLIGTQEKWTKVNTLSSTEYLNYEDTKFSKSRGVGVFGDHVRETGIPSEVWRYYLMYNRPEQADSKFLWDDFVKKNDELLKNLGNFVNRVFKFVADKFNSIVPARKELNQVDHELIQQVQERVADYIKKMEVVRLKDGIKIVMDIASLGNGYMQHNTPWDLLKKASAENDFANRCDTVVNLMLQVIRLLASLIQPFMPTVATKILHQFNLVYEPQQVDSHNLIQDTFDLDRVPAGHVIGTPQVLFNAITPQRGAELQAKYSGKVEGKIQMTMDLRVGKIEQVNQHPGADNLYVLDVRVGSHDLRKIVAGLKTAYPDPAQLVDKLTVVACNLKHAKMKGEKSEGMLIASKAGDEPHQMSLLVPAGGANVPVGTRVLPQGATLELEKVIQPKALKVLLGHFLLGDNGVALYEDLPLVAKNDDVNVEIVSERPLAKGARIL